MMRLLLSVLVIHFCFLNLSCSTQGQIDNSEEEDSSAISDSDVSGDSAKAESETASNEPVEEKATPDNDGLDEELDSTEQTPVDENVEAKPGEPSDEGQLEDELADDDLKEQPIAKDQKPVEEVLPAPPIAEEVKITDIRFMSNQNGGTLVVESTGPVTYNARMSPGGSQYIIEIPNVELKPELKKANLLKNLSGSFGSVSASQDPGSKTARIFIQLASNRGGEPIVQAEGNTLVVVPPSPPLVAETPTPVTPQPTVALSPSNTAPREGALAARTLDEFLTGNQHFYGKPLSLQVRDADVRDVINFIADDSGANIVMSEAVTGKVSLKIRKIPWDQALVTIMRAKKLGYVRQGNVLRITTLTELQEEADASAKIMESQKAISPMVVRVYPVSYANLDDLAKNIKFFLNKDGNVIIDNRTSTIVVTDKEAVMDRVAKLIRTMDMPPTQVMIEGKIVEALETFKSFMGVNWNISGSAKTISNGGGVGGTPIDLTPSLGTSHDLGAFKSLGGSLSVGTLDLFGNLSATLELAEQDSVAHVISSPRVIAMNREKAEITQGGEVLTVNTIVSAATGTKQTQIQRDKIELKLLVTPQITSDGSVIMDVELTRQFAGGVEVENARPINTRTAKTKVMVRNTQTAVIGGIYQSDDTNVETGVPLLKDIPVLGWLFKTRQKDKLKNELLLFLTPRIMTNGLTSSEGGTDHG
jgi:type IV pilus assembly protein PilQ